MLRFFSPWFCFVLHCAILVVLKSYFKAGQCMSSCLVGVFAQVLVCFSVSSLCYCFHTFFSINCGQSYFILCLILDSIYFILSLKIYMCVNIGPLIYIYTGIQREKLKNQEKSLFNNYHPIRKLFYLKVLPFDKL